MFVEELKINDRVGFCRSHIGTFLMKGFGKITKINGYGHIFVVPEQETNTGSIPAIVFDKHGKERTQTTPCNLCSAEWLEEKLAKEKADNSKQRTIQDLIQYLEGRRCSNNRYVIDESHKEEIQKLLDLI